MNATSPGHNPILLRGPRPLQERLTPDVYHVRRDRLLRAVDEAREAYHAWPRWNAAKEDAARALHDTERELAGLDRRWAAQQEPVGWVRRAGGLYGRRADGSELPVLEL